MTIIWETIWRGLIKSEAEISSEVLRQRVLDAAGPNPPNPKDSPIATSAWNQLLTWEEDKEDADSVNAAKAAVTTASAMADAAKKARDAKSGLSQKASDDAKNVSADENASVSQKTAANEAAEVARNDLALAEVVASYAIDNAVTAKVAAETPHASTHLYRLPGPLGYPATIFNASTGASTQLDPLKRLYIGDLMWLYFYDRMGVFRMLKCLIDDYSRYGRFPIEFKTDERLETMTRLAKSGEGSTAGERAAAYLRSLGWTCEGLQVPAGVQANLSFDSNWRSFLRNALAFYRGKSISNIISPTSGLSGASVVAACDSARSLWESFKPFETSSNYPATYYGLAWTIGTLRLIESKAIKNALGVSDSTPGPATISAAYEVLVLGQPPRGMDSSRYMVHNDCARYGRRILLDLQGLKNSPNSSDNSELKSWLGHEDTETNIEGFRSAWQRLTGEDLSPAVPIAVSR